MLFDDANRCAVCWVLTKKGILCKNHKKHFRFIKKHGFYAIKPKRNVSKPQTALYKAVREIYHLPTYQEAIFEFNMHRRYDIVIPDLMLELEFDGAQHFKFNKLFHKTKKRFKQMQLDEIIKENNLRGHGYTVIRFSYIEDVFDKEYVSKKLKLKGF